MRITSAGGVDEAMTIQTAVLVQGRPRDVKALMQDAKRWRFMARVMLNPEGPERKFLEAAPDLPTEVSAQEDFEYLIKIVDEGIEKFGV